MSEQEQFHSIDKNLHFKPPETYPRYFRALTHKHLQKKRDAGLPVSPAHSETHLWSVAQLIPAIGTAYGFSTKEILLGRVAAQFHDIERSAAEDKGSQDEKRSADKSIAVLESLNEKGLFITSDEEQFSVRFAVLNHSKTPAHFKNPETREDIPQTLPERLQIALYFADGLQKLGAPLIHRRSAFVGGERRIEGDLKDMTYNGQPIDAVHAILLESAVRLGWKNTEDKYPKRMEKHIKPAFEIQRDWVSALLAGKKMSTQIWAEILLGTINGLGKNIFQLSDMEKPPENQNDIIRTLQEVGKIDDNRIAKAGNNPDLVASAEEAAAYFSAKYSLDPAQTISQWNPKGERAKEWKKGM